MNTRAFRIVLLAITIICAIFLKLTETESFESMSQYADATNEIFYNGMHVFGAITFFMFGVSQRRDWDFFTGFSMVAVLLTNLYDYYAPHIIATIALMWAIVHSLIFVSDRVKYPSNWIMAALVPICMAIGILSSDVTIFEMEFVVLIIGAIHLIRREFINPKA